MFRIRKYLRKFRKKKKKFKPKKEKKKKEEGGEIVNIVICKEFFSIL